MSFSPIARRFGTTYSNSSIRLDNVFPFRMSRYQTTGLAPCSMPALEERYGETHRHNRTEKVYDGLIMALIKTRAIKPVVFRESTVRWSERCPRDRSRSSESLV